jgi:metallo-beta-lactamase class B
MLRTCVMLVGFFLALNTVFPQADETSRSWNKPVTPFRIAGNLYYVGATEVSSFLITTPEGHFLLDGGFAETAPQIERNIAELGFKLTDVKFLLNSHAHFDHAGGLAELKKLTSAKFLASERDAPLLRSGGHGDFRFGDTLTFPPIEPDQIVYDVRSDPAWQSNTDRTLDAWSYQGQHHLDDEDPRWK